MSIRNGVTVRGTSNGNERGSAETRRRRKQWLVETYRSDVQFLRVTWPDGEVSTHTTAWVTVGDFASIARAVEAVATCRCYRCGDLLTAETVTVDRIIPGCKGGTYRRDNIRPACGPCNSETGGALTGQATRRTR